MATPVARLHPQHALRRCAILVLLCGLVLLAAAPAARAVRLPNPVVGLNPFNSSGDVADSFWDSEDIWAAANVGLQGAEVCVVKETVEDPGDGSLDCTGSKAWGQTGLLPAGAVDTDPQPVTSGPLPDGTWKLLADGGPNPGEDALSQPFDVGPCPLGGFCSLFVAAGMKDGFKHASGLAAQGFSVGCALGHWLSYGPALIAEYRIASAEMPAVGLSGQIGLAGVVIGTTALAEVTGGAPGKAVELLPNYFSAVCERVQKSFKETANDPPNPVYADVVAPQFLNLPATGYAAGDDAVRGLDAVQAYSGALLTAYERYQGALADNATADVHRQALAGYENALLLEHQLSSAAAALRAYGSSLAADPNLQRPPIAQEALDAFKAFQADLSANGFTADQLSTMHDAGLTDAQIEVARREFLADASATPLGVSMTDELNSMADLLEADVAPVDDMARALGAIAGRSNEAPQASFSADVDGGLAPLAVSFTDNSTSTDGDGLTISWDFGDGTTGSGPAASHTYLTSGTYMVTETVSDYLSSASVTKQIQVGEGKVVVEVVTDPATSDQTFSFNAAFPPYSFEVTSSHTKGFYVPAGEYAVSASPPSGYKLTGLVCDDGGSSSPSLADAEQSSATYKVELGETVKCSYTYRPLHDLTVSKAGAGTGSVTSTPAGIDCGSTCTASFVDGDQVTLSTSADTGSVFTGWSGDGCSGTADCVVTLDDAKDVTAAFAPEVPVNKPPTAAFTATPDHGPGPLHVDVDASGSSDEDGSIVDYQWNWGDGSSGASISASHTYDHAGTYTITLHVNDDQGATDSTTHDVVVESDAPPANAPPTAAFSASPDSGAAPLSVFFDALQSSDSDGSVALYQWDFGDGATDSSTGSGSGHTYMRAGVYTATLKVQDDKGDWSAVATHDITVTGGPPQPADDSSNAADTTELDVLANDYDPDTDPLQVVATGTPEHGAAECGKLGGCTYTATPGYSGTDSFTYTVRDPDGHEATATVNVNVQEPPPLTGAPTGQDDDAVTRAATPVDVAVLANDTGAGALTVLDATSPQHGTVTCDAGGTCHYTPDPGFSGHDGFTYTLRDGDGTQATADVHVIVAPADGAFTVGVHGQPDSLTGGTDAHWGARVGATPTGLATDALAALPAPSVTADLGGDQSLKTGSVRTAPGWNVDSVSAEKRRVTAHAGPGALLGEAVEQPLAKPLPPTSQGTGGDGHVPILVGSKVFAFFHHSYPTSVTCVDRTTGARCPGYPIGLNLGTDNVPGPAAVVGSRIYVHLLTAPGYTQSSSIGLFCWNTATDRPCGFVIVDRFPQPSSPTGSAPVLVGGKIWFAGGPDGRLYCVDPATDRACATASLPTGLAGGDNAPWDIIAHGSRIFVASRYTLDAVACIDVAAGSACPGWATPKTGLGSNVINRHAADGSIKGVCIVGPLNLSCIDDATPGTVDIYPTWLTIGDDYNDMTLEAETGTKTLFASLYHAGLGCWDWTTMSLCTGGGYSEGWISKDSKDDLLPSAYGAAWDGSCAVGLGDPGLVFTVDPRGVSPCASLAGTKRTIDLRDQRCDDGVGAATWTQVTLADSAGGELSSILVTVRDAHSGAVLASGDLATGALDLSAIDPAAHPSLAVEATATSADVSPWSDAIPPRIRVSWHSDPQQLCFDGATTEKCAPAPTTASASAALDGTAATATKQLAVMHAACPRQETAQEQSPPPSTGSGSPSPPPATPPETAEQAVLGLVFGCTDKRVVLQDVYEDGARVRLFGYAVKKYVGKKVTIVFAATGKPVAKAVVKPDGSFSTTAPLPPAKLRKSTRARYQARIGAERSLNLKLVRRMLVTGLSAHGGRVTIKGRVIGPLAQNPKDRVITLQRVVACKRAEKVATFQPRSNGSFQITVKGPRGQRAAVYRLSTLVRVTASKSRLARTYTLPRTVAFG